MQGAVQELSKIKSGCCPHGLPQGACPICSGSGGGLRVSDKNRKIGEMTYHECVMIGNMLKARALAQKKHKLIAADRITYFKQISSGIEKNIQNFREFTKILSNNTFLKSIVFVLNTTVLPLLTVTLKLINLTSALSEKFVEIKQKIIDIADKLTAIFGEAKAFVEKKISEIVSFVKSKLKNLFKIFKKNDTDEDDTKADEDKKIFNLKTIIQNIKSRMKNKKEEN